MPNLSPMRIRQEELLLRQQRRGGLMKTVGKVLLWVDLIIVCFVYVGLESGSHLYWWWFIAEFILGAGLLGYGTHLRSEAGRRLAEMSASSGAADVQDEAEQQRRAS
jgi:hypothetical protein